MEHRSMSLVEVQIDRLVGPSHHFGGLGVGNVASKMHAGQISNPAAAALQGMEKMRMVSGFGVPQLMVPPQPRPDFQFLRELGFRGSDGDVLRRALDTDPVLVSAASSTSAMWTANAATVTPAVDSTKDDLGMPTAHLTVANLVASVHRAIEPQQTLADLRACLPPDCRLHSPLPGGAALRDEGAANHMRIGTANEQAGINIFVYGDRDPLPHVNWPRQSRAASEAVARLHGLPRENTFFLKQHPAAIDAGAFHNDVVAMSHHGLLIHHQLAFDDESDQLDQAADRYTELTSRELIRIEVSDQDLSIDDAVRTYLFNSQIISPNSAQDVAPVIVCTKQVSQHAAAKKLVQSWCERMIFSEVRYVDLDQSMSGGGGPACLRLRVPLNRQAIEGLPSAYRWSESLDQKLRETIKQYYVERLSADDLARIEFHQHAERAREQIISSLSP